ncbi:MAG: hypothetical protein UZ17_ACD001001236 [Acidobacteria bacterium OLB17]|nr:MAG: hypothetical protein UZ17_ACD001001236 [Acidobacteria bacterium OLB17]MCZ2391824.1 hypothetical protein [Acidobacteriota bacterium]
MTARDLTFFFFATLVAILSVTAASAQHRDYLTDAEIEIVRETQQLDNRVNVLVKIMDRRFTALGIDPKAAVPKKKDKTEWGPEPTGTRAELLGDIRSIMQKAIDDIDTTAERPNLMVADVTERKPKTFKEVFPVAVRNLAAAAERYKPLLQAEGAKTQDRIETGIISKIIELCDEVTASVAKLPS